MTPWLLAGCLAILPASPAPPAASDRFNLAGQVSLLADSFPRRHVSELRAKASLEASGRLAGSWRFHFEGFAEALAADRGGSTGEVALRAREVWIERAASHADLRIGYGRIVWGRLDEIQPSDVINPIDLSRYLLDGRSAARLPVAFIRGRLFTSEKFTVEGVLAPVFRRGTFDELGEESSPFNLVNDLILPATVTLAGEIVRREPSTTLGNVSGGGRVMATAGRVDLAAGVYRGFEGFGVISFEPTVFIGPAVVGNLVERFPRFTMVSGDFETVVGNWELRGEAAIFVEKTFEGRTTPDPVRGHVIDAAIGVDRGAGRLHGFASVLIHRQWSDQDAGIDRTDVTVVASIEQQFRREQFLVRGYGALTPTDGSGFIRGLFAWKLKDDVSLEASGAVFIGEGESALGRFHGRDFLFARLKYYW